MRFLERQFGPALHESCVTLAWIFWVSTVLFAASVFLFALPDPFWIVMLGIPIACLMLVVAFILLTCFLARHRWSPASAVLVAILTLCLTIAFPRLPESRAAVGAHWARLAWYKPQLDKLIRERTKTNETPVIATLGVGGVFSTETGIGYDSSDEFRKPPGTQSASWQRAARETFVEGRCWEAYPLIAHYFAFVFDGACCAKRGGIINLPHPTSVSP